MTSGIGVKNINYTIKDFLGSEGKNVRLSSIAEKFHILADSPELYTDKYNRQALQKALEKSNLDKQYDFILIDAPPIEINPHFVTSAELAICAVDYLITPMQSNLYYRKTENLQKQSSLRAPFPIVSQAKTPISEGFCFLFLYIQIHILQR